MSTLLQLSNIVSISLGESSKAKKKQAERLQRDAAEKHGFQDPVAVSPDSTMLIVNVLNMYSGLKDYDGNKKKLKSKDAVAGIISGLRWVYREAGHTDVWTVRVNEDGSKKAHGNPLEGNMYIKEFRKTHNKVLAEARIVTRSAPPLSAEQVIEHGKAFLIVTGGTLYPDIRDFMLHAFLLTAMTCGMRYDELSKVRMENFKCTKYGIEFGIGERCKNSTKYRSYIVRRWPGERFAKCILMDTSFALSARALRRGDAPGFLFCNVLLNKDIRVVHHEAWPRKSFVEFMQDRFEKIGQGAGFAKSHTGHSPKRGGVQLLRFLGVKDMHIMKWFGMTGQGAYLRYTEGYNDLEGVTGPDFSSIEDLEAHARSRKELDEILDNEDIQSVADWLQRPNIREQEIYNFLLLKSPLSHSANISKEKCMHSITKIAWRSVEESRK